MTAQRADGWNAGRGGGGAQVRPTAAGAEALEGQGIGKGEGVLKCHGVRRGAMSLCAFHMLDKTAAYVRDVMKGESVCPKP